MPNFVDQQTTVDALVEALAMVERLQQVRLQFEADDGVALEKGHLRGIRRRLYASLDDDDACSAGGTTVAGEREKLARVRRVRAAVARLAHVCRAEVVDRIPGPGVRHTGALSRLVQRLYDALGEAEGGSSRALLKKED
jgi:hypothetical protein